MNHSPSSRPSPSLSLFSLFVALILLACWFEPPPAPSWAAPAAQAGGSAKPAQQPSAVPQPRNTERYGGFWPATTCEGCHDRIFADHMQSQHDSSFVNRAYQAQYFQDVVPRAERDSSIAGEARTCTACHAPIASVLRKGDYVRKPSDVDPAISGVTCDVCHTLARVSGEQPMNGNYVLQPGTSKLGPFIRETNWHHVYSELQTKSEMCAVCHEATNRHGLRVKETYTEWKQSSFAAEGIQCQDCHMTLDGFLTAGKPRYASGQASNMPSAPVHEKLYTHRFPGAHSRSQVEGALAVSISTDPVEPAPGQKAQVQVVVDNSRTGHKMPTGSADLRVLWMTVTARVGGKTIVLPATPTSSPECDVVGSCGHDVHLLATDIPNGSRVYRAIYADEKDKPTLQFYDARSVLFDNRLGPGEKRAERYEVTIPKTARGQLVLEAKLQYLPYPPSFSRQWKLPRPEPVLVAQGKKAIQLD